MDIINKYKFESNKQISNSKLNKIKDKLNITMKTDMNNMKSQSKRNKIDQQRKINNYLGNDKSIIAEVDNSLNFETLTGRGSKFSSMIENNTADKNYNYFEDSKVNSKQIQNNSDMTASMIQINDDFVNNDYSDVYIKKRM